MHSTALDRCYLYCNMVSSVASKFNSVGHVQVFACLTYSSINWKYKTRNKVTLVGYFPHVLKLDLGRFLSISFTVYPVLCCRFALLCSGVLDQARVLNPLFVAVLLCHLESQPQSGCNKEGVTARWSKNISSREGTTKIGKTCFISKPGIWAHCLSSGNGL